MPPLEVRGTTGLLLPEWRKDEEGNAGLYPKLASWTPIDVMKFIEKQANSYGGYITDRLGLRRLCLSGGS